MATLLKLFRLFLVYIIFYFILDPPPAAGEMCPSEWTFLQISKLFQNFKHQKNWIGVRILSISPPLLLFLFFLLDLLIKVQVQVVCLSERTYRESQKLHVCICLHVSASLACALVRLEECPAVISRCPGGHFIRS